MPTDSRLLAYTERASASPLRTRSDIMGKIRKTNKEPRKEAALNPKEKKAAKEAKKQARGSVPSVLH